MALPPIQGVQKYNKQEENQIDLKEILIN